MMQDSGRGRDCHTCVRKTGIASALGPVLAFILGLVSFAAADAGSTSISKAAAESCDRKVKSLQEFAAKPGAGGSHSTSFTENEINSYLALDLSPKFGPGLKSLHLAFQGKNRLQADAAIDFDHLGRKSAKMLALLFANLFSGTHALKVGGSLLATGGKAHFELAEARLDDSALPGILVEAIITAVCKKQNPPFDPMQPSQMPYLIERVDVQAGSIVVVQQAINAD